MKKDKLKRLPMLDETILVDSKDWLKYIRSEVQHLRQAYTKTVKKGNKLSTACLDLTPAMEKRRTMAVMSSLENLDASRKKYAMDWIALNVFSENYAPILSTGHLLTAASMWILDRLTELNIDFDAVYPLLPTDETEIEDFYIFDVWDCQYDEDLIASVEYVLHNRNQDIAPLESSGGDGFRVITSDLAANGRDRADVPSRKNFEGLLELLPEWMKKQAVKHFEECYQVWMDRFFAGIAYLQIELHDKRSKVNSIRREINEQMEQFEKKTAQVKKERKLADTKPKQPQVNPLLNKPVQPALPTITQNIPLAAVSPLSAMINGNAGIVDKDKQEIDSIIARLEILSEQQGKAIEEFDNALDNLANFIYTVKHNGYLTTEAVNSLFPPELHSEIMKPLPMTDPYELCFALIYLVEIGSDIPWLYGSCISMMTEVADHLPWGIVPIMKKMKTLIGMNCRCLQKLHRNFLIGISVNTHGRMIVHMIPEILHRYYMRRPAVSCREILVAMTPN